MSEKEARILTYIHNKFLEKGNDYFLTPQKMDEQAIIIMLGKYDNSTFLTADDELNDPMDPNFLQIFDQVTKKIQQIDIQLREKMGLENRLHSELNDRLRVHTDNLFREKMLTIYYNIIVPKMIEYTKDRITNAINNYWAKLRQNDSFLDSLDI